MQSELAWNDFDADSTLYSAGTANVTALYTVNKPENKITLRNYYVLTSWTSPSWIDLSDKYVQKIWYR